MRSLARTPLLARWLMVAGWMLVIFGLSSLQGSAIPGPLGAYSPAAHFTEYAILGALLAFAVDRQRLGLGLAVLLLAVGSLYGVSDEYHQSFVPGRMVDPLDWLTDTAGVGAGIALWVLARRRRERAGA